MELIHDITDSVLDFVEEWLGVILVTMLLSVVLLIGVVIYWEIDSWHLHEGVITTKTHTPMWIQQQCTSTGKSMTCYPIVHPESWSVTIRGIDDRGQESSRTIGVSRSRWEELREGEHLKVD